MENSKIEWTHHTFNPWYGCVKVSQGCANCYAESQDKRFGPSHWGPGSERKFMSDAYWKAPVKWNADAEKAGERRRVFCASMADVCELLPENHPDFGQMNLVRHRLRVLINDTPHPAGRLLDGRTWDGLPEVVR